MHPTIVSRLKSFSPHDVRSFTHVRYDHALAITAESAAGKTTTVNWLKNIFPGHMRFVSGGALMRVKAQQHGMDIEAFSQYNRSNPEKGIDLWLDQQLAALASQNFHVLESRLAHMLSPAACRIKLICPIEVRASRRAEQLKLPVEKVLRMIQDRDADDNTRYRNLYPGCIWPDHEFDAVVNTEENSPEQVVAEILETHKSWKRAFEAQLCSDVIAPDW